MDTREKQLVFVGLGNPGKKYEMTRHNMGSLAIQGLAQTLSLPLKEERKFLAQVAKRSEHGVTIHLVVPTTYMNESGQSVRQYLDYHKLTFSNVIVVVDDIALPFGELRLRSQGSAGGHNGLKSVEQHLGTDEYARLRIGIGRNGLQELRDYVLDNFSKEEFDRLPEVIGTAVKALRMLENQPLKTVMNVVNAPKGEEKDKLKKEEKL